MSNILQSLNKTVTAGIILAIVFFYFFINYMAWK